MITYKNVPPWIGVIPYHRPVLDSTMRFVGDAVALVAAETEQSVALDDAQRILIDEYSSRLEATIVSVVPQCPFLCPFP